MFGSRLRLRVDEGYYRLSAWRNLRKRKRPTWEMKASAAVEGGYNGAWAAAG